MLRIAGAFREAGHSVELVLCKREGPAMDHVPTGMEIVTLRRESGLAARMRLLGLDPNGAAIMARPVLLARRPTPVQPYVADLARYLERERPDVLLAAKTPTNLHALWARRASRAPTRVIVSERTQLSESIANDRRWRWRYIAPLVGRVYAEADAIVCVSDGVADDLARTAGLPRARMTTIYNPIVTPALAALAAEAPPHPWLAGAGDVPLVLGVGRLTAQKNFGLLLHAFAKLRAQRPARLLILGEGPERPRLEALAQALGIAADVALAGHVSNPYAAFGRASLFVLSSDYEGLPAVLIEALACGCPVVSTDCPSGPAEILDRGRYGRLVPVGDEAALVAAMQSTLVAPPAADMLRRRGAEFSVERSATQYLALVEQLLGAAARS
jgi:glycosyltransferase involved in cell wall biosynthesis